MATQKVSNALANLLLHDKGYSAVTDIFLNLMYRMVKVLLMSLMIMVMLPWLLF